MQNDVLKDALIKGSYIAAEELDKYVKDSVKQKITLYNYLIRNSIITSELVGQALAEYIGVSYYDLSDNFPSADIVKLLPEDIAKKYKAVVVSTSGNTVNVVSSAPKYKDLLSDLQSRFPGKTVNIFFSIPDDIDKALKYYKKDINAAIKLILNDTTKTAVELVNNIIESAVDLAASDIHIEPTRNSVLLRYRVDGVLRDVGEIPKDVYTTILNRVKVSANLRIDEHFSPQDGSIRYDIAESKFVDLRVSIVPLVHGEKIVIRILTSYVNDYSLENLGLSALNIDLINKALSKPFGMIITTGPTGSGKTTTLYALLNKIKKPEINITTIEDPVEYVLEGINQIQVNKDTHLDFATGLRSIVRQDPDVILVGEVRDTETAEISINAALTGHMLLTTFHANNAASAVPRLVDMDIEPYILASTLELLISQRLVRKVCNSCKYSTKIDIDKYKATLPNAQDYLPKNTTVYMGKGCEACGNTGYLGRLALFEVIEITEIIQQLIINKASSNDIWLEAKKNGTQSLFADGIEKVKTGLTTLEEVLRVASPDPVSTKKKITPVSSIS